MAPSVMTAVCLLGIAGMVILDRESKARVSSACWVSTMWLLISGSRHVSSWFGMTPTMSQAQYMEGSPIDAAVYALLIAAGIAILLRRQRAVARLLRKNWPLVIFVSYCAVSLIWSDYPGVAFKRWIKSLGDYIIIVILLTEREPTQAIKQVLARVSFVLLPLSLLFIKYYPQIGRQYAEHWVGTQFFVGVADTKNMLGMGCMVFGFAAAWRLLQAWTPPRHQMKQLIIHGTIAGLAAWLLFLSDSKTSLSAFVLTIGVVSAHSLFRIARRRLAIHVMAAGVLLTCVSVLFLGVGGSALETLGRNSTLTGRTDIWDVLLQVPVNPLLGTGFESFWLGHRLAFLWSFPIVNGITEAHNGYLELYLNLGILGIVLLIILLSTGYRNILKLLKEDPDAGRLRLGLFIIAIVYNLTEAGIRSTDLVWIALLLAITAVPRQGTPAVRDVDVKAAFEEKAPVAMATLA